MFQLLWLLLYLGKMNLLLSTEVWAPVWYGKQEWWILWHIVTIFFAGINKITVVCVINQKLSFSEPGAETCSSTYDTFQAIILHNTLFSQIC